MWVQRGEEGSGLRAPTDTEFRDSSMSGGEIQQGEEESLALFEGKEGQVGKMTLLGHRSREMAPRGSVFLGDMRVPSSFHLICIFPAPPATELKIWSEEGSSW